MKCLARGIHLQIPNSDNNISKIIKLIMLFNLIHLLEVLEADVMCKTDPHYGLKMAGSNIPYIVFIMLLSDHFAVWQFCV